MRSIATEHASPVQGLAARASGNGTMLGCELPGIVDAEMLEALWR
jgi:hypothetical protein